MPFVSIRNKDTGERHEVELEVRPHGFNWQATIFLPQLDVLAVKYGGTRELAIANVFDSLCKVPTISGYDVSLLRDGN